ncbi:hypothetical protein [Mesorhizobium neociceri]|uniref:Transposase DDE domain-containing protein n=1 Tax=Mesorhizobium neociceri TaxID=1307853 RepID=A0A838BEV9_9HYPH|nr:hypothetical protein [Mesorhizobium neociceri]MBA1145076.1 hypothetical protein [Mesorhizobium neociceri]
MTALRRGDALPGDGFDDHTWSAKSVRSPGAFSALILRYSDISLFQPVYNARHVMLRYRLQTIADWKAVAEPWPQINLQGRPRIPSSGTGTSSGMHIERAFGILKAGGSHLKARWLRAGDYIGEFNRS